MKILYITTIGSTMNFFTSFVRKLLDEGHVVDIATNESSSKVPACYKEWGCTVYQICTSRSPLDKGNLKAIKQIKEIVGEKKYDIVHCHTPVAAMCTRLACRKARKKGTKVFYTAHGFHFYKGAPLKNWLLYYPVEKLCAHFTDILITINQEDYALAKRKMKAKRVEYVPGVGIDLSRFENVEVDRAEKRREIGVPEDAFLLLSVGELNENKNHEVVLRAVAKLNDPHVHYAIAGIGNKKDYLLDLAKELGVDQQLHLLGYRRDIPELDAISDAFCLPSLREGLPVSIMEAMACGLPVACSEIRGNADLIDEFGGLLFNPSNDDACFRALESIINSDVKQIGMHNKERAREYSIERIAEMMKSIYDL